MSEYFTNPEPLTPLENISKLRDNLFLLNDDEQEVNPEEKSNLANDFANEMEQLGFHSHILEGSDNPLPELVQSLTLIDHNTLPDEQTVRLYRAVRPSNGRQLAHQVGYLLKRPTYDQYGHVDKVELESDEVFQAVGAFSKNPSYRALIEATEMTSMSKSDRRFVDDRIKRMRRDLVMSPDRTLLNELTSQHVAAPWGVPTQDLSPFVATSLHPNVAAGRGGNTLMIIDVPLSEVAGLGEGGDEGFEVLLTGSIPPEWITAVAELHYSEQMSADTLAPLVKALGSQENITPAALRNTDLHQKSKLNHQEDLREVNHDLIEEILSTSNIDDSTLREIYASQSIDTYKDALWMTAEYYLRKIQATGRRQNDDIRELYQYDDVTPLEKSALHQPESNEYGLVIDDIEQAPRELNIKEIEKLAGIYANVAKIEEAYARRQP